MNRHKSLSPELPNSLAGDYARVSLPLILMPFSSLEHRLSRVSTPETSDMTTDHDHDHDRNENDDTLDVGGRIEEAP